MTIRNALIIAEPWITHILEGRKDWEMRSQATAMRGWFGLIRKGSGTVVGLARLVECGKPLSQVEMIANTHHHLIPEDMIRRGEVAKWVVPWKLSDIVPIEEPVTYEHKSGAVIWVNLSPDVCRQLEGHLDRSVVEPDVPVAPRRAAFDHVARVAVVSNPAADAVDRRASDRVPMPPLPEAERRVMGRSVLSGGNIRNYHIKLAPLLHAFPKDVIGGSNRAEAAPCQVTIEWGGPDKITTDIDGTKSIFRARGWVRRFFAVSQAKEGDVVVFAQTSPYQISVHIE